jgi:LysR family transcriptional activator of mexEF-oprN operon
LSMVWSGVHDNDPAERWLRSRIATHMSQPLPAAAAASTDPAGAHR